MDANGSDAPEPDRVDFYFSRGKSVAWALFCLTIAVVSALVAILAPQELFLNGFVPGWLFGTAGAVLFVGVGVSWAGRSLHKGPALVLERTGIQGSRVLGGPFASGVGKGLSWDEVASVEAGTRGSIVIHLNDPAAFWARQSLMTRIIGWHPSRRDWLGIDGSDLEAEPAEVAALIAKRASWIQEAESRGIDRRLTSGDPELPRGTA